MSNLTENRINGVIAPADVTTINTAITTVTTKLPAGGTLTLSEEEEEEYVTMKVMNRQLVQDTIAHVTPHPALVPAWVVLANVQNDLSVYDQLVAIQGQIKILEAKIEMTKRVAEHESYSHTLAIYRTIKGGAADGVPGAQAIYDLLKDRFDGQGGPGASEVTLPYA